MSSDNTKRWELIKEASRVAAFHKQGLDPTIQKALIGGGIGAGLGGASALLGEDDEEEGRGSKAMRRALIGGGLGAAAGGAYGLATDAYPAADKPPADKPALQDPGGYDQGLADLNKPKPPAAETPVTGPGAVGDTGGEPNELLPEPEAGGGRGAGGDEAGLSPTNDPSSPSHIPSGPETAAGPEAPAAPVSSLQDGPSIGQDGILSIPGPDGSIEQAIHPQTGQPIRVPDGAEMLLGPDGAPQVYVPGPDGSMAPITPEQLNAANGLGSDVPPSNANDPRAHMTDSADGAELPTAPPAGPVARPADLSGDGTGLAEGGTALQTPQGPETMEDLQQQVFDVLGRIQHSQSVGAPTADDQRQLGYLLQRQSLLASNHARQQSLQGPNARPGDDGVFGTPDDGTGPTNAERRGDPPAADSPAGRQAEADRRQDATANQAQARQGPKARPGPDGVMGTKDDGTGPSNDGSIHDRHPVDEAGQRKARLGPNARPGPDGVMGTKDDGQGPTIAEQAIIDKYKDQGQEKKNSWNVTSMPSPEEAVNFGYSMAKQAAGKKKKKSKKRHRQVLVGPKGKARYVPKPEEDDEKMAALRMRAIVERGTANFFSAR